MSGEVNEPFSGGGFRFNGRKRGRFHSPDYSDGGIMAKLYIAPIPRTTTEENIRSLFEEHGSVVEVVFPWDKRTGQQQADYGENYGGILVGVVSGTKMGTSMSSYASWLPLAYCFVKYATYVEADRAIRALDNQYAIPGEMVPIKVRFADGERERLGGPVDKIYVGSVNKQASRQEIEEIFSPYGHVEDVYIVRDELKQSRVQKLCHELCVALLLARLHLFVIFEDVEKMANLNMALAAIKALNGTFTMRGCDQPLIVRFADPKKPKTGELRPAPNFGDSMGGCFVPDASFSMQQMSATGVPQAVNHAAPHITEQPLSSVKHSPPQLSQPTWTESTPQETGHASVAPAVPPSPQMVDPVECDWSEHSCPDGYKYYYNCITCESRWEKPVEFILFQQQLQKQQKLHSLNQHPSLSPAFFAEEVDQTQKVLLEMLLLHQKLKSIILVCAHQQTVLLGFYVTSTLLHFGLLTTNQAFAVYSHGNSRNLTSVKSVARN
ncbi:unnamed protein product [Dovyalis caffra]|uniref:Flowering time control protein FCA n=1 Tax=Dovyalis caffra TaxID=77055 RepID=A0AAV1SDE1_9ROSI|nr:unnamed protein product [Dovyalis caffra]